LIHPTRIQSLNTLPERSGRYVLYWAQQAPRARCNHALEFAIQEANARSLPVLAVFGVTDRYPEANARHYAFLLEGLQDAQAAFAARGVRLAVLYRSPERAAVELAKEAALLVTDRGYLRIQRAWRRCVADTAPCPVVQVETDAIVPIEVVSPKEEYAAATLRPKITRHLRDYLVALPETPPQRDSLGLSQDIAESLDLRDPGATLARLDIDRSVLPVSAFRGGTTEAYRRLELFAQTKLERYAELRSDPAHDHASHLSPYLHYGHISPLAIALRLLDTPFAEGRAAFLEELIVRRELSLNFVHYNAQYDTYDCLPAWARQTLADHAADPREVVYTLDEFERAATHDPYWNAAQQEMVRTGKMHNYLRMYWGKKILEWSATPEGAFATALILNNKYELDGRDANSFAGVAWCFGKHDRPWAERPLFGKVRYMNAAGLRRKFDIEAYVQRINCLTC
jgi:deoxyribodipyrimidine photo-lyase